MNASLKKIMFYRYKKLMIFLCLLITGVYLFQTISGISSWNSRHKYFSSPESYTQFEKQLADSYEFEDAEAGKIFLYYDLNKDMSIYTNKFDDYKKYSLTMFNPNSDANQQSFNSYPYYDEHFLQFAILFGITGILLFLLDLKTNFNALLFTSKFKRSTIYWYKYYFIGGTLSLTLLVSKIASIFAYRFFIPINYLNISLKQHIISSFSGWLFLISLFLICSFAGLVIGDWFLGIAATLTIFFTLQTFLSNIEYIHQTFFTTNSETVSVVKATALDNLLPVAQTTTQPINYLPIFILILFSLSTLFFGQFIFNNISLEEKNNFIMVSKFKRLFQLIIMIYGLITTCTGLFIMIVFPSEVLNMSTIILNWTKIILTFLILFFISEYILFNKKPKLLEKLLF
ncbi:MULTISPECIES: hypothetical protein [Vagococcus]|uniref:Uncharacterized protein n=1 Tax=Vagococcus fluvialis bH819 TaxID=1255619 RepID=A0A1X6WRI0_9ENTE|nr:MULTISPECIES: hypothetical protein [Vagococcus]SLM86842.1 hypothetical protein FM121_12145 [Vagococcus fluvialis bH819]HCM88701.1 hypothetical protein [Vagococcus sp.]